MLDALEPRRLGTFGEAALGCDRLSDTEDAYETGLSVMNGPALDIGQGSVPWVVLADPE